MKKYLLMGGLVFTLSAYASTNPFDISKNMQKIEAEDTSLLDTLDEESSNKGDIKSDDFVVSKKVKEEEKATQEETVVEKPQVKETPKAVETPKVEKEIKRVETPKVQTPTKTIPTPQENTKVESTKTDVQKVEESVKKPVVDNTIKEEKSIKKPQVETKTPVVQEKKVVQKEEKVQADETTAPSVADINLTQERLDAQLKAQKELEEAIKDVDRED